MQMDLLQSLRTGGSGDGPLTRLAKATGVAGEDDDGNDCDCTIADDVINTFIVACDGFNNDRCCIALADAGAGKIEGCEW